MAEQIGLLPPGLTDDERKFFETRGESGLPDPAPPKPGETPPPAPAVEPAKPAAAAEQPPAPAPAETPPVEDDDDEDMAVDPATGKRHPRRIAFRKFRALEDRFNSQTSELADLREKLARGDERMKIINEALSAPDPGTQEPPEPDDPRPDPTQDVFAYIDWQERENARRQARFDREIAALRDSHTQQQQAVQATREDGALRQRYHLDAVNYAQANPAFGPAYQHLMRQRMGQYAVLGVRDPLQLKELIENEERSVVAGAYQAGQNPAERLYQLAVASGFDPRSIPGYQAPAARTGAAPAPAAAAPPINVQEEIENVRRGQQAALSLSQGGGSPPDRLTPEIVANMTEDQFKYFMEHTPKERIRELMGG